MIYSRSYYQIGPTKNRGAHCKSLGHALEDTVRQHRGRYLVPERRQSANGNPHALARDGCQGAASKFAYGRSGHWCRGGDLRAASPDSPGWTSDLFASTELDEFARICDRVLIFSGGAIVGELTAPAIKEANMLHLCLGENADQSNGVRSRRWLRSATR